MSTRMLHGERHAQLCLHSDVTAITCWKLGIPRKFLSLRQTITITNKEIYMFCITEFLSINWCCSLFECITHGGFW